MEPRLEADSEARNALILNALAHIPRGSISVFDKHLRYLFAAGKGWADSDLEPHDLIGKTLTEVFPAELVEAESHYRKVLEGQDVEFDIIVNEQWYSISAAPVFDENHEVIAIIVIALNSDERKNAEFELARSEAKFRTIFQSAQDAILLVDDEGHYIEANPAACELIGVSRDEVLQLSIVDIAPAEFRHRVLPQWQRFLSEGKLNGEFELARPDGAQRIVEYNAVSNFLPGQHLSVLRDITESKAAERTQLYFASIIESTNDAIIGKTLDGIITTWNKGAEKLYGYTAAEAIGQHMSILLPPDRQDEEAEILQKLKRGEHIPTFETRRVCREGHTIDVAKSSSPIFNSSGEIIGASSIARDISERKQSESALRASEERFQDMVANMPGMVYQLIINPDGSVEWPYISEGCQEIFGMTPEALQTMPTQSIESIVPEDRPSLDTSTAFSAQTLEPWNWEGRHYLPTGELRWIQGTSRPQRLPNGGTLWNGLVVDITDRKQAEEKLAQSAAILQATFEATADGILIVDNDGQMTHFNQQFISMWQIPDDIVAARDNDRALDFVKGQLVNPQEFEESSRQPTPDPEHAGFDLLYFQDGRVFERFSRPLRLENHVIGRVWCFRDIAERQRALQEQAQLNWQLEKMQSTLEQANEELEDRVIARTAQLEQAVGEARAARAEAEQANHAKSEFLSRMSHELRTPMNAILGFGQILEMRSLAPRDAEGVQQILKAGRHLLKLINEILEISRIEAGGLSLSIEPIGVLPVLRETLDLMQPLAQQKHVTLINQTESENEAASPGGWFVMADRQRLQQVMLNLISNSIKYNREEGKVFLSVSAVTRDNSAQPNYLRIVVRDTGMGISAENQEKLFLPFERLGAEKTATEGTGIGLHLAQRLTELMHGFLGVESSPGQGSTFWIELPIAKSPTASIRHISSQFQSESSLLAIDRPLTFLYIEDNSSNLSVMETLLEEMPQVRLLTAIQGSIGLDLARQHHPDLILLDLHLPDIQGDEVLQRLKSDPATSQIPVVMVSADATSKQIERLRTAGVAGYVTKPFDIQRLISLIEHIFKED